MNCMRDQYIEVPALGCFAASLTLFSNHSKLKTDIAFITPPPRRGKPRPISYTYRRYNAIEPV